MLFPYFEMYDDFQLNNIIGNFSNDKELYKKMIDTQSEIRQQLQLNGYTEQGTYSMQIRLSEKGREAKNKGGHFAYIRSEEEKLKKFNEKESLQYDLLKADLQKANLEIGHLVDTVSDYHKVKSQAKWSIRYAAISTLAALAAILIALLKK